MKTNAIDIKKRERSLSEEFYSQSPNTQKCIKFLTCATPTSKVKSTTNKDYIDDGLSGASPATQTIVKFYLGIK